MRIQGLVKPVQPGRGAAEARNLTVKTSQHAIFLNRGTQRGSGSIGRKHGKLFPGILFPQVTENAFSSGGFPLRRKPEREDQLASGAGSDQHSPPVLRRRTARIRITGKNEENHVCPAGGKHSTAGIHVSGTHGIKRIGQNADANGKDLRIHYRSIHIQL